MITVTVALAFKVPYKPIKVYPYEQGGMLQERSEEKQETFKHC